jgi:hypothetical protein
LHRSAWVCKLAHVDPLLLTLAAQTKADTYAATFAVGGGHEVTVLMRSVDGEIVVPSANLPAGWSTESDSFTAVLNAVQAMHLARQFTGSGPTTLSDVDGGWDVGLGNVVLSADGHPTCVAHGEMVADVDQLFACTVCEARARYG